MADEIDELLHEIIKLVEDRGCEIVRRDVRKKEAGANWNLDMRLVIKPIHAEEVE